MFTEKTLIFTVKFKLFTVKIRSNSKGKWHNCYRISCDIDGKTDSLYVRLSERGWPIQTSWLPFSMGWNVWYRWKNTLTLILRSPLWFLAKEFLWFEPLFFWKKGVDRFKFRCSSFPSSDLCDIDGKTFSLHVRLSEQSHFTFALVFPSDIYVRLSGLSEISQFCGCNPQF